jgi:tetratricopeptide (TPR) repeat protein
LFEGVADEDVLAVLSNVKDIPARFAGVTKEVWSATLGRLAGIGLLTSLGGGMYGLHPALPFYLTAEWRRMAVEAFASEHGAAEDGLLTAYSVFGSWLLRQIHGGAADSAFLLIEQQRRTMGRLVGFALSKGRHSEAQQLLQPLDAFWEVRGLGLEGRGWVERCRRALESNDGTPPDLDSKAGALWLFVVGTGAARARRAGLLESAYATYDLIRRRLEASRAESRDPRLAVTYHELGMVAQHRGDLAVAEDWYRKSLEIEEALGNRRGMSSSYHQLGMVAQDRGDLAAAEGWYRKSLEIEQALGDRPGMGSSYGQLGLLALDRRDLVAAEGWFQKSLEVSRTLGDRPTLARTYHNLGGLEQERGDLAAAEDWYRKSLEIEEALGNLPDMATSYHQLGTVAQDRGDLAAAEGWYRKSLEIFKALSDRPRMAASYYQLGRVAQDRGDLAAAEGWYRKSLEIDEALDARPSMALSYHQLGRVAQYRGDLAAAEDWFRKSLEIKEALGNRPGMALTYGALGLLAEARKDLLTALDWTVRCVALFSEFPHPATGAGPHHLVRLTASLGLPALEASWQSCTGAKLPDDIRTAVVDALGQIKS